MVNIDDLFLAVERRALVFHMHLFTVKMLRQQYTEVTLGCNLSHFALSHTFKKKKTIKVVISLRFICHWFFKNKKGFYLYLKLFLFHTFCLRIIARTWRLKKIKRSWRNGKMLKCSLPRRSPSGTVQNNLNSILEGRRHLFSTAICHIRPRNRLFMKNTIRPKLASNTNNLLFLFLFLYISLANILRYIQVIFWKIT
jgi:hypothetical protein